MRAKNDIKSFKNRKLMLKIKQQNTSSKKGMAEIHVKINIGEPKCPAMYSDIEQVRFNGTSVQIRRQPQESEKSTSTV